MNKYIGIFLFGMTLQSNAQELNDLPRILKELRNCNLLSCEIKENDLYISINATGNLTIFRRKSYGSYESIYAEGKNIKELLQNFAAKLNKEQAINKSLLENIAPYLATQ